MIKKKNKKKGKKRLFEIDKGGRIWIIFIFDWKRRRRRRIPRIVKSYETNVPMSLRDCLLPHLKVKLYNQVR